MVRKHQPLDADWLRHQYWDLGRSTNEIAQETDRSNASVRDEMERLGIPRRTLAQARSGGKPRKYPQLTEELLRREYWESEKSLPRIAREQGVPFSAVANAMVRFGVPRRPIAEARGLGRKPIPIPELTKLYLDGESTISLARRYRVRDGLIKRRLLEAGVRLRTRDEAAAVAARKRKKTGAARVRPSEAVRRAIIARTCLICGLTRGLEVHHVNGLPGDSSPDNLVPLCANHHALVEWLIRKARPGQDALNHKEPHGRMEDRRQLDGHRREG